MTTMQDLRKKSDQELIEVVEGARKTIREERFKDRFSRKASVINTAKTTVARVLTELTARRRTNETK